MKADFYIQSKGKHAGRPLKKPIPNCFAVSSDISNLFEIVYALYVAKRFNYIQIGSVIPFIRIKEAEKLIIEHVPKADKKALLALNKVDELFNVTADKLKTIDQMRIMYALKALNI